MPRGDPMRQIQLRLPEELIYALDVLARERGVSRNECIRQAIRLTLTLELRRRREEEGERPTSGL
jgi:metal-responsive CopG/Arc/MetJ family transcriptional regulator